MQEVLTLVVFVVFAWLVLDEKLRWNYAVSLLFILLAVVFAFAFDKPAREPGLAIGQEISAPDFRCRFCPLHACPPDAPKKVS